MFNQIRCWLVCWSVSNALFFPQETGKSGKVEYPSYPQPVSEWGQQPPQQQQPSTPQSPFSLPPHLANLLATMTQGQSGQVPATSNGLDMNGLPMQNPQQQNSMPGFANLPIDMNDPNIQQLLQAIMVSILQRLFCDDTTVILMMNVIIKNMNFDWECFSLDRGSDMAKRATFPSRKV
jgi:hypothetical protein